jgi:transposase
MVRRGEITDRAWQEIEPLLPQYGQSGGQWRDHRTVVNGILWKLRTGSPWRDLPEKIRSLADLLRPLQPLEARRHLGSLAGSCPDQERRGRRGGVGGERGRHGDPGPPARRGRQEPTERGRRKRGLLNPEDEALGRSRGGFSTKLHLACDGKGRPLSVVLTPGQRHGSTQLEERLDAVRVPRPEGSPGRPRKRPAHLLAERGYSFESCRGLLRRRGIPHTIPERKDQKERREGHPGRRPGIDREAYRRRNVVERCVNRLKQWRAIATRYEKRAVNYRAVVVIASLMMWLSS